MSYNYKNVDGFRPHSYEYSNLANGVFEGYIGSRATISIFGNYVRSIIKLPGSLTQEEYNADPFQSYNLAVSQDFKRITKKGRLAARFKTFLGKDENNEIEITSFGGVKNLEQADILSYTELNRYTAGSFLRFRNKSKIAKHENDFNIGFDYAFQSGPSAEYDNIGGQKGLTLNSNIDDNVSNLGVYFYEQFGIIKDKFDIYLSGRYDKFIYERNNLVYTGVKDTSRIFEQFTPKIALNYKLTPVIALYTSFGLGFDVPAASELNNYLLSSNQGRTTLNPDLDPQKSKNFEIGIKGNLVNKKRGEWLRKMFFDVTFFNYDISDDIVPFSIAGKTYFRNAAKTNRTGLEIGFKSEPVERVDLMINYIFTNFKYKEYDALVFDTLGNITHQDYTNNKMPSYPSHMVNFILEYEYEISKHIEGLLVFDCDYVTKMFVDDKNSQSTSPYFYSNPMAGINVSLGNLNILGFAGASNIFDKRFVGFINTNDYYGRYYEPGEPRNVYGGINISYKY